MMNVSYWEEKINNKTVVEWIKQGVPANFHTTPQPFNHINRNFNTKEENFIDSEIERLINLKYISKGESKFISSINVVPKPNKKYRLVIDLRNVNAHTVSKTFKNESIEDVIKATDPTDVFITFDIKDGYYHIPLHNDYKQYFAFKWKDQCYIWNVLCFGWSLSPYYFCKIIRCFVGYIRNNNIKIVSYVDDFILPSNPQNIENDKNFTLKELKLFGLPLNEPKSDLKPSSKKKFIGFIVETDSNKNIVKISIPSERIRKVKKDIKKAILKEQVSARFLARIAGQLISMTKAILPTKLMLRKVYKLLATKKDWNSILNITKIVKKDLEWWLSALDLWNGKAFNELKERTWITIETDASKEGWGAQLINEKQEIFKAQGNWTRAMSTKHSNIREITAVLLTLKTFKHLVTGKSVLLRSDNVATVAYINMQGGPSQSLSAIATEIWEVLLTNNIQIKARFLQGLRNKTADRLSRLSSKFEWILHPNIFQYLEKIWGKHTIDRFASHQTHQITTYNSFFADPLSSGVDALMQKDWASHNNYVNAPLCLMDKILNTIILQRATATVIAPKWPATLWHSKLKSLSIAAPIQLPKIGFCIPMGTRTPEPFRNSKWRWYAWRICGKINLTKNHGTHNVHQFSNIF